MTDKPTPTDAELFEVIREAARGGAVRRDGSTSLRIARAVLAKWGTPAPAVQEPVVQDDLITIRKPTSRAEMMWLIKLAHLVISDVNKTLDDAFAPALLAAQEGKSHDE